MAAIMNIQNALLSSLKRAAVSGYFKQPIPSEIDQGLSSALSDLASLEHSQMEQILGAVSGDDASIFGLYAERMASLAVRKENMEPVKDGLFALIIFARTADSRDVLLLLSLLHDAAVKNTGTAQQVFEEVGSRIGGTELLKRYLKRSDEDKSIGAMGYEESTSEDGFLYVRIW